MFIYDEKGNKHQVAEQNRENFKASFNSNSSSTPRVVEHYGNDKSKCPKWLWIVLASVGGLLLIVSLIMLMKSRKRQVKQNFGFRFY